MATYGSIAVSPPIVVLLCICGAAAVVCMGVAVHKLYTRDDPEGKSFNQRSVEQDQYMAELRQKYLDSIYHDMRGGRRGPPHHQGNGIQV